MAPYRRRTAIRHVGDAVHVDVEDYQHRFALVVRHDNAAITAIEGHAIRTPWAICPGATAVLDRFLGLELDPSPFAMMRKVELAQQCTHMADMACIAASGVARGDADRTFDVTISLAPVDETDRREVEIARDGTRLFTWNILNNAIQEPERLAGLETFRASRWADDHAADANELEAIFIAHRTVMISNGLRYPDIEVFNHAANSKVGRNACYSMQEVRIAGASRSMGSVRLFGAQDELLANANG